MSASHRRVLFSGASLLVVAGTSLAGPAFDCGSDGSDGALNYDASPTPITVEFDPVSLEIDPEGDGIYHFTTVTIGANVTLHFDPRLCGWQPQHWLATGDVTIDGVLDLSGGMGHTGTLDTANYPSLPGPGGYPGGVGQNQVQSQVYGFGPGGGGFDGNHTAYGNIYLQPLTGGSGGAGWFGTGVGGGGAGAGAILVASNGTVTISGTIDARGGQKGPGVPGQSTGGTGSGGGVRIVAPFVAGSGAINAGAKGNGSEAIFGRVRIESNEDTFTGSITCVNNLKRRVTLIPETYVPPASGTFPLLRVVSVDGIPVPSMPWGTFDVPDVEMDDNNAVTFEIEAANVPVGTTATLYLFSENGLTQTFTSTALAGTLESSTATASATVPQGFAKGYVYASW